MSVHPTLPRFFLWHKVEWVWADQWPLSLSWLTMTQWIASTQLHSGSRGLFTESMLQPHLTQGRKGSADEWPKLHKYSCFLQVGSSYTCIVGGCVLHEWLEIKHTEHVVLHSTQPRPSSDTRSTEFQLLSGTSTFMTEKNRKDSFHTVVLHHNNCTQRADVCTRRQKYSGGDGM